MKLIPVLLTWVWLVLLAISAIYDFMAYIGVLNAPTFSSIIIAWSEHNRVLAVILGANLIAGVFLLFLHLLGLF